MGDKITPKDISEVYNITLKYATTLITTFQNNGTLINPTPKKRGRRPVITHEHLVCITELLKKNNTQTDKQIAEELKVKFNLPKAPHKSTIQRCRKKRMSEIGQPCWTVKKWTVRNTNANTEENKARREAVARNFQGLILTSHLLVFIDETHFDFHRKIGRAKSPAGEKAIVHTDAPCISLSAICAISTKGLESCVIIENATVTADRFLIFFQDLVLKMGTRQCVFFMDNAPVHNKLQVEEVCKNSNQTVIFNAPHSPELNPIENFFGLWKKAVMAKYTSMHSKEDIYRCLQESINEIDEQKCCSIILNVANNVTEQAIEHQDM